MKMDQNWGLFLELLHRLKVEYAYVDRRYYQVTYIKGHEMDAESLVKLIRSG